MQGSNSGSNATPPSLNNEFGFDDDDDEKLVKAMLAFEGQLNDSDFDGITA